MNRRQQLSEMRWPVERAKEYMTRLGVIKGVNFVPSYCYGYIEMWHHYDEPTILRELGYAKEIGINSVRIFVSQAQWQAYRSVVYPNLERFLDSCKELGISVMLSLAAGTCIEKGYTQKLTDPIIIKFRPGIHDRSWQFEGTQRDAWKDRRQEIKDFVADIVTRYAHDDRVAIWDLYNEAPAERVEVVNDIFEVARGIDPMQPLTACWEALEISDVVTFHCYMDPTTNEPTFPMGGRKTFQQEIDEASLLWAVPCSARNVSAEPSATSCISSSRSSPKRASVSMSGDFAKAARSTASPGAGRRARPNRSAGSMVCSIRMERPMTKAKSR